ncbi:unnamed protein product [Medioppia subpectinata]|uniref:C2H2-type domain-containing protein n=1 Tax=Medioppia subpectinata TaxID=1979941 RepID=A0A7R9PXE7_9ACAR|nr:unnamed protein product [Medioppia subpectinata]CAG2104728.1 unnamed protein product [Medioppia subpectinata]
MAVINESEVLIAPKTSPKTAVKTVFKEKDVVKHESRDSDIGVQEVGLECNVNLVSNEGIIDGTADESDDNVNPVVDETQNDCDLNTRTDDKSDTESGGQSGDDYCNDSSDDDYQPKNTFAEHYMQSSINCKIDYKFRQEINALKHLKESLVSVNQLNVDNYSNVITESEVLIAPKTSPKTTAKTVSKEKDIVKHEPRGSDIGVQEVGLECNVNLVSNEVVIDETVDESDDNVNFVVDETQDDCDSNTRTDDKSDTESGGQSGDDYCNDSSDDDYQPKNTFAEHYMQSIAKHRPPPTGGKFVCDVEGCEKSYKTKRALNQHRMAHFGKRFYCSYEDCNKHLGTESMMIQHRIKGPHVLGGRPYVCGIKRCVYETRVKEELESHIMTIHYDHQRTVHPVVCDECGQHFNRKEFLAIHMREDHSPDGRFKCEQCDRTFGKKKGLRLHRENERCRVYRCQWLGCRFRTPYKILLYYSHVNTHSKGRPKAKQDSNPRADDTKEPKRTHRCEVEGCGSAYKTEAALKIHSCRKHGNQYACDWPGCDFRTGSRYTLDNHVKVKHTDERLFPCALDGCQLSCRHKTHLLVHQLRAHPDHFPDKPWFKCEETDCEFRTKCKYAIDKHVKDHNKSYECDICGKVLKREHRFVMHRRAHTQSIRCSWPGCETVVASEDTMRDHYNTHTKAIVYRCLFPGCEKTFLQRTAYFHHKSNHKSDRPRHRCHWPECDYETSNRELLKRHIDRHNGVETVVKKRKRSPPKQQKELKSPKNNFQPMDKYKGNYRSIDERSNFRQEINALKHLKESLVSVNQLNVDNYSNVINESEVLIAPKTTAKTVSKEKDIDKHEPQDSDIGVQEVGLECDVNFVSNEVVIDGTVDESDDNVNLVVDETQNDCDLNTRTDDKSDIESGGQSGDDNCNDSSDDDYQPKNTFAEHYMQSMANHRPPPTGGQFACDVEGCEKSYKTKRQLNHHRMAHFGKRFYCSYEDCNKHLGSESPMIQHRRTGPHVLGGRPYVCGIKRCVYETRVKEELESHIMSIHYDHQRTVHPVVCDECGQHFNRKEFLAIHMREDHSPDVRFKCKQCDRTFRKKESLRLHRQNKRCRVFRCKWPGCKFRTPYKILLYGSHENTHSKGRPKAKQDSNPPADDTEEPKRTHRCEVEGCRRVYKTEAALKKHSIHKHGTQHACHWPGCDFRTGLRSVVDKHVKVNHSDDRPFLCGLDGCQLRCLQKSLLLIHQIRGHPDHFPDKPWFKCDETNCEFRTKCKYRIATHIKGHTKPFVCDICGKGFQSKNHLIIHRRAHTETIRCSWPGCETVVASEDTMRDHYNTHTKAIVYECLFPGCDKTFLQRTSYFHHKSNHKSDRPRHRCHWPECDYETSNRELLKRHIDRHNGVETVVKKRKRSPPKTTKRAKKSKK